MGIEKDAEEDVAQRGRRASWRIAGLSIGLSVIIVCIGLIVAVIILLKSLGSALN